LFFNKKNITPPVFSGVEQYSSLIAFSKIMFMGIIRQFWQETIRIFILTKGLPKNQLCGFVPFIE
jgi:hypothetical protein